MRHFSHLTYKSALRFQILTGRCGIKAGPPCSGYCKCYAKAVRANTWQNQGDKDTDLRVVFIFFVIFIKLLTFIGDVRIPDLAHWSDIIEFGNRPNH